MFLKIYKSENLTIALLLAAAGGMGVVIGMTFPLFTLVLERDGYSASLIGLNGAMGSLGILVVGLLTARMLARYGAFTPLLAAVMLSAVSLLALPLTDHAAGLFGLRFSLALGIGFVWLLSESRLNALARDDNRGRIIGLYSAFYSAGLALGPLIVAVTGSQGITPFAIAAVLSVIFSLPMLLLTDRRRSGQSHSGPGRGLLRLAPVIFMVAFAAGLFETTAYTLLPVHTLARGLTETVSLYALSAFSAGGIALQYPLGRLADIAGRRALLMVTAIGIMVPLIALPYAIDREAILMPLLFLWGGMVFGLYTTGLIMLGDRYGSGSLVAANALFIIFYEAGAVIGPVLSGGAMDLWPGNGFTGFLLVMAVLLTAITIYRMARRG